MSGSGISCGRPTCLAAWSALTMLLAGHGMAAETWKPSRPVRMITANLPGSAPDVVARLLAGTLTDIWSQQVIVDNRAGATGLIAAETIARSSPDGHTLWLNTMTELISTLQAQRLMLARDFAPVSLVASTPFAVVVSGALPVKTMAEWIAYARARPGKLSFGSSGAWGSSHLCMEAINRLAGIEVMHVPYKGSPPVLNDLVAGRIEAWCPAGPSLPAVIQSGRVRLLAVTYQKPTPLAPGLPPVSDTVPGFELRGWYGLQVPLKTPAHIVAALNAAIARAARQPELMDRLNAVGAEAVGSTVEAFATFLQRETTRWDKVLKEGGSAVPPARAEQQG